MTENSNWGTYDEKFPADRQMERKEKNMSFVGLVNESFEQASRIYHHEKTIMQLLGTNNMYSRLRDTGDIKNEKDFLTLARQFEESLDHLEIEDERARAALIAAIAVTENKAPELKRKIEAQRSEAQRLDEAA